MLENTKIKLAITKFWFLKRNSEFLHSLKIWHLEETFDLCLRKWSEGPLCKYYYYFYFLIPLFLAGGFWILKCQWKLLFIFRRKYFHVLRCFGELLNVAVAKASLYLVGHVKFQFAPQVFYLSPLVYMYIL